MFRRVWLLILMISVGAILFLFTPLHITQAALSEDELNNRCWLRKQCQDFNGVWGLGDEFRDAYKSSSLDTNGDGRDDWSEEHCIPYGRQINLDLARCFSRPPNVPLQVGIPGLTGGVCSERDSQGEYVPCSKVGDKCGTAGTCRPGVQGGFPGYLAAFYKFFVAALVVVAIVMVMWGGFKRIMAAGSPERIKDANDTIISALSGVVIALLSYSLLQLINPQLVANSMPLIEKVKPQVWGNCPKYSDNPELYHSGYIRQSGICSGGTLNGRSCNDSSDCKIEGGGGTQEGGAGTCVDKGKKFTGKPDFDTCGSQLVLNGTTCRGVECGKNNNNEGCFPVSSSSPTKYACGEWLIKGSFKKSNINFGILMLDAICGDNSIKSCYVTSPGGTVSGGSLGVSILDAGSYAMSGCYIEDSNKYRKFNPSTDCTDGLKGFALVIQGKGTVVDASTCTQAETKPIITTGNKKFITNINWSEVSSTQLFQNTQTICNLFITSAFEDI